MELLCSCRVKGPYRRQRSKQSRGSECRQRSLSSNTCRISATPRPDRKPDGRGRLWRPPRDPGERARYDRRRRQREGRAVQGLHPDLEFPVREWPQRADPARSAGRSPDRTNHAAAPSGVPALVPRGFRRGGSELDPQVDTETVRELVDEAGRELAADMATDILIIEDEPLIAMDLEALVEPATT